MIAALMGEHGIGLVPAALRPTNNVHCDLRGDSEGYSILSMSNTPGSLEPCCSSLSLFLLFRRAYYLQIASAKPIPSQDHGGRQRPYAGHFASNISAGGDTEIWTI